MHYLKAIGLALIIHAIFIFPMTIFGVDRALVLPKGVNHLGFRYGNINALGDRYFNDGQVYNTADRYSQALDLEKILKVAAPETKLRIQDLINTLNQMAGYDMGSQLHPGTLRFEAEANIQYYAPVYARGITNRWTLGIGIPIVQYRSNLRVKQSESNFEYFKQQFGGLNPAIYDGLVEFEQGVIKAFYETLETNGYEKPTSHQQSFIGDIQILSMHQIAKTKRFSTLLEAVLQLPTGPKDDPDNFLDLSNFHQTGIGVGLIQDFFIAKTWSLTGSASYFARLPDQSEKRVPLDEDDVLPGPESKETVHRDLGDTITLQLNTQYEWNDYFATALGVESNFKGRDNYSGSSQRSYYLLSEDTQSEWHRGIVNIEYSTVKSFLKGISTIPYGIMYEFSDYFAGRNVERQQLHEIVLKMYF